MAYQTGTATGAASLLSALESFASTNGWTIDDSVGSDKFALHKNSCYVSFRYDSSDTTGSQIVSIHQALGHTPAALPGDHPDDSGSGYNSSSSVASTNLDNERYVNLGLSPDELANTYHFFEHDDGTIYYIHVVVVRTDGQHRHFGFGKLSKFGTWDGGEYCYGHGIYNEAQALPVYSTSSITCLLDGRFYGFNNLQEEHFATVHLEPDPEFDNTDSSTKWGEIGAAYAGTPINDTGGNPRIRVQGWYRGGPIMAAFGNIALNRAGGYLNMLSAPLFLYVPYTDPTPDRVYYIGEQPDVKGIVLDGLAPGEEITVGTETWIVFPSLEKSSSTGVSGPDNQTLWQGIAYRKETA